MASLLGLFAFVLCGVIADASCQVEGELSVERALKIEKSPPVATYPHSVFGAGGQLDGLPRGKPLLVRPPKWATQGVRR